VPCLMSTRFRDALLKAAAHLTPSELSPVDALLVLLDLLEFTLPLTMLSLPLAVRTTFLLSELMEMEVLLFHGKHVALLPLTLLNMLVVT